MNKLKRLVFMLLTVVAINSCGSIFDGTNQNAPKSDNSNNIADEQLCKDAQNTCLINFSVDFCTADFYKCMSYIKN